MNEFWILATILGLCAAFGWILGRARAMAQMAEDLEIETDKNMNPDAND